MLTNKWIVVALGALITLIGYFSTVDWATLLPSDAGGIIAALGLAKVLIGAIMPSPGQGVIRSTGGSILTHT